MPIFVIMNILPYFLTILLFGCLNGCAQPIDPSPPLFDPMNPDSLTSTPLLPTFLALGDSYTIGERVEEEDRWPNQLAVQLNQLGYGGYAPQIIARTGWTTNELMEAIAEAALKDTFPLVSLLIGVNNQYRGYPFAQYETEFPALLQTAIDFAGGDSSRIFVVSIPDYGVTTFGQTGDPDKIATELDAYNAFAKQLCESRNIRFFDITPLSREALNRPELIAPDGLHPSGLMYQQWVQLMIPGIREMLGK